MTYWFQYLLTRWDVSRILLKLQCRIINWKWIILKQALGGPISNSLGKRFPNRPPRDIASGSTPKSVSQLLRFQYKLLVFRHEYEHWTVEHASRLSDSRRNTAPRLWSTVLAYFTILLSVAFWVQTQQMNSEPTYDQVSSRGWRCWVFNLLTNIN